MVDMGDIVAPGRLAVVTGAASGIGLAVATRLLEAGMRVVLVDANEAELKLAGEALAAYGDRAVTAVCDVADEAAVRALAERIRAEHGPVSLVMNNAAIGGGGDVLADSKGWTRLLDVNFGGVLHGVQAFVPAMIESGLPGIVVNTGSKQGITQPPGNTAYNVAKSAVKSLTEGLAHTLRQKADGRVTAHLLIPGFTYTGMMKKHLPEKPASAWTPEQVADFLLAGLENGDFYILCPDNETPRALDNKRMAWAMGDLIEGRPALSRWHPDYAEAFDAFMKS